MSSKSARSRNGTRITITIPPTDYAQVCRMAKAMKVSNAWIIRDAVEKYFQADASSFSEKEAK